CRIGRSVIVRKAMFNSVAMPDLMAGAVTTLTLPVGLADGTILVLDSSQFPSTFPFRIKIGTEYMQVAGHPGGSTWTVSRGLQPTVHSVGDVVTVTPPNPFAGWHPGINND